MKHLGENGEGRVYVPSSSNENAGHSPKVVVAFSFGFGVVRKNVVE